MGCPAGLQVIQKRHRKDTNSGQVSPLPHSPQRSEIMKPSCFTVRETDASKKGTHVPSPLVSGLEPELWPGQLCDLEYGPQILCTSSSFVNNGNSPTPVRDAGELNNRSPPHPNMCPSGHHASLHMAITRLVNGNVYGPRDCKRPKGRSWHVARALEMLPLSSLSSRSPSTESSHPCAASCFSSMGTSGNNSISWWGHGRQGKMSWIKGFHPNVPEA